MLLKKKKAAFKPFKHHHLKSHDSKLAELISVCKYCPDHKTNSHLAKVEKKTILSFL